MRRSMRLLQSISFPNAYDVESQYPIAGDKLTLFELTRPWTTTDTKLPSNTSSNKLKDQNAAFTRDERVFIVWSDSLDTIITIARDFEDRLIRLLWRTRPPLPSTHEMSIYSEKPADPRLTPSTQSQKCTWFGRVVSSGQDPEKVQRKQPARPIMLYAPIYNGLSAALALIFIGNGLNTVLQELRLDGISINIAC
ncbi:hypothetical protein P692DRAFT_20881090 [Suillus brevipes Sb2]|nr:hypothetical protein P692DRAFT_201872381 [Suillus brevipes Sb2]KAG2740466.1 hypothetical protein P692DRAFT_20881090 [Suillus brevipes Sb2]